MRTIAGAIVVLAGSILFAGGAVADSIVFAGPHPYATKSGMLSMFVGAFVGLIGLGVMSTGRRDAK